MDKPWHLYITNGATDVEKLEFEDRIHLLVHYNQVEDIRTYICGHQFASFSCNVKLTYEEFLYTVSRVRYYTLPAVIKPTPFPIYVANWEDGRGRIALGKNGFTLTHDKPTNLHDLLIEAWDELWLDTHNH